MKLFFAQLCVWAAIVHLVVSLTTATINMHVRVHQHESHERAADAVSTDADSILTGAKVYK